MTPYDFVLVGGGLQSGLIALAVLAARPDARLVLIERAEALGGNHTWSYHAGTIPADAQPWFSVLAEHSWPRYRVRFPGVTRVVEHPYATLSSAHFQAVVGARLAAAPHAEVRLGAVVAEVHADRVVMDDGEVLHGALVVDARGPLDASPTSSGFQKFVGLEVELAAPLSAEDATTAELIDATVEQLGGFRFVYLLPYTPTRALIEDTVFANDATLDVEAVRARVVAWMAARGLVIKEVLRVEQGVLPMPWRADPEALRTMPPLVAGYRGGWFHPATGYSVPVAVRLALHVAAFADRPAEVFGPAFEALVREQETQSKFAFLLNDMLFHAAEPASRWKVFRHFYELPDELVLRFYGLTLTAADKRRMFLRKPPPGVSFVRAMRAFAAWGFR